MTDHNAPATDADSEERLAALHLRTGALLLARAELESLAARGAITGGAFADLAEARWRTGDLERAAEAAAAHLTSGGEQPIALLILAEAETAAGRPEEARGHRAALVALTDAELTALFAGMPHRANWPSLSSASHEPRQEVGTAATGDKPGSARSGSVTPTQDAHPDSRVRRRASGPTFPEAGDLLNQAREDMRSGEPERMAAAFDRLALALRLDPSVAANVVDLVTRRHEPAALLVRGDAMRILGRALDAEAAYIGAAAALDKRVRRSS